MTQKDEPLVAGRLHDKTLILQIQSAQIQDPETSEKLGREMIAMADANDVHHFVIDFSKVQFMGSIGFLALMRFRRHLKDSNIILCGLNPTLQEVFQVCKLISSDPSIQLMFIAVDTVEQAQNLIKIRPM